MLGHLKWTLFLAAFVPYVVGFSTAVPPPRAMSSYQKHLQLLSNLRKDEFVWRAVMNQPVYYEFERKYYGAIVDGELLPNALETEAHKESCTDEHCAVGDPVKPRVFLRNLFAKRFRIGSLVQQGVEIVQKSLVCLAYKHMSHLMYLVRTQVARMDSQRKAVSWSAKAKKAAATMVMRMAAFEWSGKNKVLEAARFFDVYERNNASAKKVRFNYTSQMDKLSKEIAEYIRENCVKQPRSPRQNAKEIKVPYTDGLFAATTSVNIKSDAFKTMLKGSLEKINEHFSDLPTTVGMSLERWNDILNFIQINDDDDKEDDSENEYQILHIVI